MKICFYITKMYSFNIEQLNTSQHFIQPYNDRCDNSVTGKINIQFHTHIAMLTVSSLLVNHQKAILEFLPYLMPFLHALDLMNCTRSIPAKTVSDIIWFNYKSEKKKFLIASSFFRCHPHQHLQMLASALFNLFFAIGKEENQKALPREPLKVQLEN